MSPSVFCSIVRKKPDDSLLCKFYDLEDNILLRKKWERKIKEVWYQRVSSQGMGLEYLIIRGQGVTHSDL